MSADLAGFAGGLLLRSDTGGEEGWVSSESSSESVDDQRGPSLTSMALALASASAYILEVSSIRVLTTVFIAG